VAITCVKRGISCRQSYPGQTEEFESCFRIGLPIIQASSNDSVNLGVAVSLRGLSYPSPKLPGAGSARRSLPRVRPRIIKNSLSMNKGLA
jgi:hypothetical protein